jgi:hypothetical protein
VLAWVGGAVGSGHERVPLWVGAKVGEDLPDPLGAGVDVDLGASCLAIGGLLPSGEQC